MRVKKMCCMVLACLLMFGTICAPAKAVETEDAAPKQFSVSSVHPRATERFSIIVGANETVSADTVFPMVAGETVRIQAYYHPSSASMDFGIVDSEETFYYFSTTNGSIDETIQISKNGDYTFRVKNNSNKEVEVTGFVNY